MTRWRLATIDDGHADWRHAVNVTTRHWPLHLLSSRQRRIMLYLVNYQARHHSNPTWQMIATACDLRGPSTVGYHLHRLQELGWVRVRPDRRASIQVIAPTERTVVLPPLTLRATLGSGPLRVLGSVVADTFG